jgi:hypothetical protein
MVADVKSWVLKVDGVCRLVEVKDELALLKDEVASSVASCVDLVSAARSYPMNRDSPPSSRFMV